MLVGVDLNGVLADANTLLLALVKAHFQLTLTLEELTSYDALRERIGEHTGDRREARWLKATVNDPDFIGALKPYPDVITMMLQLQERYDLRIVTGHEPSRSVISATERWVKTYFGPLRVDFTAAKDGWCRQTRARIFLEDAPKHALALAAMGVNVYLPPQPYNELPSDPLLHRLAPLDIATALCQDRVI